jgi:hypothetical protein
VLIRRASGELAGALAKQNRGAKGAPEAEAKVRGVLAEVPAAAEVATTEAAHMAAAKPAEMTAAEAAYVAAAKPAHVAEVSAGEVSPAAMERRAIAKAVVEMVSSEEDRAAKTVIVIRIKVSVTVVVAGAAVRPVGVIAAGWITSGRAGDHSRRHGPAWIIAIAVSVTMPVSPNIAPMTYVTLCDVPVNAMCDPRMGGVLVMASDHRSMRVMVSDRRRICGGNR